MKTNKVKKIVLRSAAGVFASLSLFGGVTAHAVHQPWDTPPGDGSTSTYSSVPTNLWCAWFVNGLSGNVPLYPIDSLTKADSQDPAVLDNLATTKYDGQALTLTGWSVGSEALVAGYDSAWVDPEIKDRKDASGTLLVDDPFDCSWYNAELGFSSTVSVDPGTSEVPTNQTFVAHLPSGDLDEPMNFGLTLLNESDGISVTFAPADVADCDTSATGFNLLSSATLETTDVTALVAKVEYASDLGTALSCKWDTKFEITMPAGLTPASPGADYTFTGPTLKTTIGLMVPAP